MYFLFDSITNYLHWTTNTQWLRITLHYYHHNLWHGVCSFSSTLIPVAAFRWKVTWAGRSERTTLMPGHQCWLSARRPHIFTTWPPLSWTGFLMWCSLGHISWVWRLNLWSFYSPALEVLQYHFCGMNLLKQVMSPIYIQGVKKLPLHFMKGAEKNVWPCFLINNNWGSIRMHYMNE